MFGHARDLARGVDSEKAQSENGAFYMVNAIHKRDSLAILSKVYADCNNLINCQRGSNESVSKYETRSSALLSKFNSHGKPFELREAITAFMLMSSPKVSDNHRVSILAAAAQDVSAVKEEADVVSSTKISNAEIVQSFSYEIIALILRQCERSINNNTPGTERSLHANQGRFGNNRNHNGGGAERLCRIKDKFLCRKCGNYGY